MDKTKANVNRHYNVEVIKDNIGILYKTSYSNFGYKAAEKVKNPEFGHNGRFSTVTFKKHLISAGNYRFHGINTKVDVERYHDNAKDWIDKLG